ncbi:coil containing protein [Vibrio phage 1.022.O._10N.286.45.A10]|nr:coil containing protein [Vibrio phage 1.022.O._10N.286.45.A10]
MKTLSDIKELLGLKPSHDCRNIFDHVQFLIRERDDVLQLREAYNSNVKDWRELCGYFNLPVSELSAVMSAIDTMRKERDEAQSQISEITKLLVEADLMRRNVNSSVDVLIKERGVVQGTINGLKQLLELPESAGLTELFNAVEALELNKSQLSEIRYVLHGDIQPCSVLYSDDTTTLLRLDEGDMMLETDTIEWSDSVTYRCQELLKGESKRSNIPVTLSPVKLLAQLVRDERILLNDNGDDEIGADGAYFREENKPCVAAVVVPAPPPFPRGAADHNNPYVHTTLMFSETAMRSQGWTDEALVSCGHGHYAPVQHPATPGSPIEQPCDECGHVFDADSMTCPMCNTIRPPERHPADTEREHSKEHPRPVWHCKECLHDFDITLDICPRCHTEWTDNNSPTPLR